MPIDKLWRYTFSREIDNDPWWYDPNNPRITLVDTQAYLVYYEQQTKKQTEEAKAIAEKEALERIAQVQAVEERLTKVLEDAYMESAFPELKAMPAPKEELVELELF